MAVVCVIMSHLLRFEVNTKGVCYDFRKRRTFMALRRAAAHCFAPGSVLALDSGYFRLPRRKSWSIDTDVLWLLEMRAR